MRYGKTRTAMFGLAAIICVPLLPGCMVIAKGDLAEENPAIQEKSRFAKNAPYIAVSTKSFDAVLDQLQNALDAEGFKTFAIIDHAKGAATVGTDLAPTTTIIFGNPKGGTPLMLTNRNVALDLPLKALVYQSKDQVFVVMQNIEALGAEYHLSDNEALISKISETLQNLLAEATK